MAKGLFVDGEKVRAAWAETLKSQEGFAALWGYKRNNMVRLMRPGLQGVGRDQLGKFVAAMGWDLATAREKLGIVEREEPEQLTPIIGTLFAAVRSRLKMSQEELAGAIGVTSDIVSRAESANDSIPTAAFRKLAKLAGLTPKSLEREIAEDGYYDKERELWFVRVPSKLKRQIEDYAIEAGVSTEEFAGKLLVDELREYEKRNGKRLKVAAKRMRKGGTDAKPE